MLRACVDAPTRSRAEAARVVSWCRGASSHGTRGGLRLQPLRRRLEGSCAEEEVHDVSLVRLEPVELDGRNGADIQAVDMGGFDELPAPGVVVCDGAAYERLANLLDHLGLWALHHGHVGEHILGLRDLAF